MTPPWLLLIFSCAIALTTAISSLRKALKATRRSTLRASAPTTRRRNQLPPRPALDMGARLLRSQVFLLVFILLLAYLETDWIASDYGLKSDVHPSLSATIGLCIYLAYAVSLGVVARLTGHLPMLEDASFAGLCAVWPRRSAQKRATFVAICLNPITEEFIYRGVLVWLLGNQIGSHPTAVVLGLLIFWAVHLYQGPRALLGHTLTYAVIIILLYSPLGLIGAIGFHYGADVVPILTIRSQMNRWVSRHGHRFKAA